jgi:hypothetical protein
MSDFWARKIADAQPQQPAPAPAPQAPAQQGPWWQQGVIPTPQQQQPQPEQQPQPQQVPEGEYRPDPTKAKHLRVEDNCPECGSGDYFRPHGTPNAMPQCYTCGYNPRFAHSTAGAGLPGGEDAGPATPARQVASGGAGGKSNYQPSSYIARNVGGS